MASPFNELPIPMSFSNLKLGSDLLEYSTETLSILADGFVITSQNLAACYWLRYEKGGKQKWQRVGHYDLVAREKLLLERRLFS